MATNQSQKEKLESDLKREIKKLQRFRDQIKSWMSGNDIKDKKQLMEQRKLIETACEKEMKTKAFSREGLTNSIKLDPREKEKVETSGFISSMLEELEHQIETLEAEQETLQATMKKNRKDATKQERLGEIEEVIERHSWHVRNLELILRLLENGNIAPDVVNNIHDDIQYYVESNQDPEFAEDDEIYDELNLDAYGDDMEAIVPAKEDSPLSSLEELATDASNTPSNSGTSMKPAIPLVRSTNELKYASAAAALGSSSPATKSVKPAISSDFSTISGTITSNSSNSSNSVPASAQSTPQAEHIKIVKLDTKKSINNTPQIPFTNKTTIKKSEVKPTLMLSKTDALLGLDGLLEPIKIAKERIITPPPLASISKMLENSYLRCPNSVIADRPHYFQPETYFPTPSYYPQEPMTKAFNSSEIFSKMDVDTLFYIFYYRQGTYQQYLAACELKARSWRFHKRFLTWFQRHEEPKVINNDYEQGTYRYFDFEGMWLQRRKSNFKFEYQFLEDDQ
ncbi:hypothetical protein D0Z03_001471 [Geotrichum reessii]|nr:hypothetical protein D0Z03_001471 [Galactomyces reessii]